MKQKTLPVPFVAICVSLAWLLACVNTYAEPKLYFVHSDHLGTPQVLTDENQTIVWKAEYTPFGEATVDEDPDGDGVAVEFNLRFPGQYFDKETGTNYNYFRTYDPSLGRYIQSDPIGLAGGISTYGYVYQNPNKYTDPLGLQTTFDTWCGKYPTACAQVGARSGARSIPRATPTTGEGEEENCPDCESQVPRTTAMIAAYQHAGIGYGGGTPEPWSSYNPPAGQGRGSRGYAQVRQYLDTAGANNYGEHLSNGARVVEHPQGHPDQPGPSHHNCPHFHATNSQGIEAIFEYKSGS